jgi:hypothetical protein
MVSWREDFQDVLKHVEDWYSAQPRPGVFQRAFAGLLFLATVIVIALALLRLR